MINMYKKLIPFICLALSAVCMTVIFIFSSQNSFDTNMLSRKITSIIVEEVFKGYDSMDLDMKNIIVDQFNLFIRKTAHFLLYFFLGYLCFSAISALTNKYAKSFGLAWSCCFIYAVLDELHQKFVPGRTPLFKDVIIDSAGGLIGIIFGFLIISAALNIRNRISNNNSSQGLSS